MKSMKNTSVTKEKRDSLNIFFDTQRNMSYSERMKQIRAKRPKKQFDWEKIRLQDMLTGTVQGQLLALRRKLSSVRRTNHAA